MYCNEWYTYILFCLNCFASNKYKTVRKDYCFFFCCCVNCFHYLLFFVDFFFFFNLLFVSHNCFEYSACCNVYWSFLMIAFWWLWVFFDWWPHESGPIEKRTKWLWKSICIKFYKYLLFIAIFFLVFFGFFFFLKLCFASHAGRHSGSFYSIIEQMFFISVLLLFFLTFLFFFLFNSYLWLKLWSHFCCELLQFWSRPW